MCIAATSGYMFGCGCKSAFVSVGRLPIELAQMLDLIQNAFWLEAVNPRDMIKTSLEVMLWSADFLQGMAPCLEVRLRLAEFRNKLEAFYYFQHVDSVLKLQSALTLPQMLERASTLGPFFSVWTAEGLGHYYAHLKMRGGQSFLTILSGDDAQELPRQTLVPLHAGMGLALAESFLDRPFDATNLADHFCQLCRANARPGYIGVAIEALGLVARTLRPEWIPALDQEFGKRNQNLLAYFWHGVGRGVYFISIDFLSQGYEMCTRESPHNLARLNAVSGYVWALVLVNIRQPEIVAAFLRQQQRDLPIDDAIYNGIFSALVIWLESAPQDGSVGILADYQPECLDPALTQLWNNCVRAAARDASLFHQHSLDKIGDLFRYQPLATLMY